MRTVRAQIFSLACFLAVSLVASVSWAAADSSFREHGKFPIWGALGTNSFVVLGQGEVRDREWGAYVVRGKDSDEDLCVGIVSAYSGPSAESDISLTNGVSCGRVATLSRRPIIRSSTLSVRKTIGGPLQSSSVIALAVEADVVQVVVERSSGPSQKHETRLISRSQQAKAKVGAFRYLTISAGRRVCIEEIIGLDSSGGEILRHDPGQCA